MGDTQVNVRIYGQDYTIAGERDEEQIMAIAEYVDEKMHEIAGFAKSVGTGSIAVLTAVNVADELFELKAETEKLRADKEQLEKDTQHYIKMWDDAKLSFAQYKEDASRNAGERQSLQDRIDELEAKCNEYESAYFDLQMENLQMKSKLDKLSK